MSAGFRQVVLVGAGHAHIEVLRRAALKPLPGARLTVVVDRPDAVYSGMVPGLVAGEYDTSDVTIDAAALARAAGAELVVERAVRVDAGAATVHTDSGRAIAYDFASLDVGSSVAGQDTPGVREHAVSVRPIQNLIARVGELSREAARISRDRPFRLLVAGAGAGGVELAFCFEALLGRSATCRPEVIVADAAGEMLGGSPAALVRRVERAADRRGIRFEGEARVVGIEEGVAHLHDGRRIAQDAVIWVVGPAAHPFLAASGLPVDAQGFVRVRPTLQVEGHENLFAVGDCASLPGMQKAGVYAVRSGPILSDNLAGCLLGKPPESYTPQKEFLSLLNLGDDRALGVKWGMTFEGRWVRRLKDRIDRSFMEKYR